MSNAFALYSDAELETLISQFKAALPKAMAGQRVRVGDSEYDRATIESLKVFGDALAREKARRAGAGSRLTTVRPRRSGPFGGWW
jgi:hypothetical protein